VHVALACRCEIRTSPTMYYYYYAAGRAAPARSRAAEAKKKEAAAKRKAARLAASKAEHERWLAHITHVANTRLVASPGVTESSSSSSLSWSSTLPSSASPPHYLEDELLRLVQLAIEYVVCVFALFVLLRLCVCVLFVCVSRSVSFVCVLSLACVSHFFRVHPPLFLSLSLSSGTVRTNRWTSQRMVS
jgi:hypothetical protein